MNPVATKGTLIIICAWCKTPMGSKPADKDGITHGICGTCEQKANAELEALKQEEQDEKQTAS
jgi:hypothetical protein